MKRVSTLLALCSLVLLPATGCGKKDKGSKTPDEAAQEDVDPMVELQTIPEKIQAEVDLVLQPILDVDVVVDQLTSIPTRYGINAADLTAMASAKMDGGTVEVDIGADAGAEAKAEIETMLATVAGIGVGLKETPQRAKDATGRIVELGARAVALSTKLQSKLQAKVANPLLKGEVKAKAQADLNLVVQLNADIKATIGDAKATVASVPNKGVEALSKLTAALAGGAST